MKALSRRLQALEAVKGRSTPLTSEVILRRASELRAAGLEDSEAPSEFDKLFSPNQICRMAEIVELRGRPPAP